MLIRLLRDKGPLPFFVTIVLGCGLLVWGYFSTEQNLLSNEVLVSHWAFGWLHEIGSVKMIFGLLLVVICAIVTRFRPRAYRTILGSGNITMVVFMCLLLTQDGILLRPDVLIALLASIGMFATMFSAYDREEGSSQLFHIGMLVGIAFVFVGQSIFLILGVFFSLFILRSWNWREWLLPALGMAMVGVFAFLVLIWAEDPLLAFQRLIQTSWISPLSTPKMTVGHIMFSIVLLISVPSVMNSITSGSVAERNFALSLLGWTVSSLLCVLVLGLGWQNGVVLAAFPLSIFIAKSLEAMNKWWLADLLFIGLLLSPILSNLSLF